MKERELREVANCAICGKPFGKTGASFYRVRVRRYVIDAGAISRQAGLTAVLGGSAAIAMAMGPDEEMATKIIDVERTVCEGCAMVPRHLVAYAEEDE